MSFLTKRRTSARPAHDDAFPAAQLFLLGMEDTRHVMTIPGANGSRSIGASCRANRLDKHTAVCMEARLEL